MNYTNEKLELVKIQVVDKHKNKKQKAKIDRLFYAIVRLKFP